MNAVGHPARGRRTRPSDRTKAAGYIAKYATKATETATGGTVIKPIRSPQAARRVSLTEHARALVIGAWTIGERTGLDGFRRWAHQFGYGGHTLTKSRRYSVTFAALRSARAEWRRTKRAATAKSSSAPRSSTRAAATFCRNLIRAEDIPKPSTAPSRDPTESAHSNLVRALPGPHCQPAEPGRRVKRRRKHRPASRRRASTASHRRLTRPARLRYLHRTVSTARRGDNSSPPEPSPTGSTSAPRPCCDGSATASYPPSVCPAAQSESSSPSLMSG